MVFRIVIKTNTNTMMISIVSQSLWRKILKITLSDPQSIHGSIDFCCLSQMMGRSSTQMVWVFICVLFGFWFVI